MGSTLKKDKLTGALLTISYEHHEVHDGNMYEAAIGSTSIANDGWISLATPAAIGVQAHFTFEGSLDGNALLELFEDPTYATAGAATSTTPARNMHRGKSDFPGDMIVNSSSITGGTSLVRVMLPGGKGGNAGAGTGGSRHGLEWITNPTKKYLVQLTNKAGQAKAGSLSVNFYTHDRNPDGVPAYWSSSA